MHRKASYQHHFPLPPQTVAQQEQALAMQSTHALDFQKHLQEGDSLLRQSPAHTVFRCFPASFSATRQKKWTIPRTTGGTRVGIKHRTSTPAALPRLQGARPLHAPRDCSYTSLPSCQPQQEHRCPPAPCSRAADVQGSHAALETYKDTSLAHSLLSLRERWCQELSGPGRCFWTFFFFLLFLKSMSAIHWQKERHSHLRDTPAQPSSTRRAGGCCQRTATPQAGAARCSQELPAAHGSAGSPVCTLLAPEAKTQPRRCEHTLPC